MSSAPQNLHGANRAVWAEPQLNQTDAFPMVFPRFERILGGRSALSLLRNHGFVNPVGAGAQEPNAVADAGSNTRRPAPEEFC
jgi:hypothetical protein